MPLSVPCPPTMLASSNLTIGVVGFGNYGQFLGKTFAAQGHRYVARFLSFLLSFCLVVVVVVFLEYPVPLYVPLFLLTGSFCPLPFLVPNCYCISVLLA